MSKGGELNGSKEGKKENSKEKKVIDTITHSLLKIFF
jgi:hypothetical protein